MGKEIVQPPDEKWVILNKVMKGIRSWRLPEGDYLEFGVYKGLSFIHAYNLAQKYGLKKMRFYAFDSFEGISDNIIDAEQKYDHFYPGQYACSLEAFETILKTANVDRGKVTLTPGFYEDTLNETLKGSLPIKRAAVVWVDCDVYTASVPVLDFITDYVTTGSFIIFDDWFSFGADPNAGEMRATNEWLQRNKNIKLVEYHKFHTAGISFLVQKSEDIRNTADKQ